MSKSQKWICNVDGSNYATIEALSIDEALHDFVRYGMEAWTEAYNPDDVEPDHAWEPGETVYYRAFVHNGKPQDHKRYQEAAVSVAVDPDEPQCQGEEHAWTVRETGEHSVTRECTSCGCEWFTDDRHSNPHEYPDGVIRFIRYTMPGGDL